MRYDPQRWLLSGPRGRVRLSPHQAVALEMLTAKPGRRVDREVLWHALYRHRRDPPAPKTLDVMMYRLRRRLRAAGVDDAVATVWGGGWVWKGEALERGGIQ